MSACPSCNTWNSRVLDTRRGQETGWYIRRRECYGCKHRWVTYEVPAEDVQQATNDPPSET